MAILAMNAKRQGYVVDEDAQKVVRDMLSSMTLGERMDFGNARGMRNTLEKLVQEQANRLAATEGEITREMLQQITAADARAALCEQEEQQESDGQTEQAAHLSESEQTIEIEDVSTQA